MFILQYNTGSLSGNESDPLHKFRIFFRQCFDIFLFHKQLQRLLPFIHYGLRNHVCDITGK